MNEYLLRTYLNGKAKDGTEDRHFDKRSAEVAVSEMYHGMNGRIYKGERYSIEKASEIKERYSGLIPKDSTCWDVYVAVNAQYHDYCELFTAWFGEDIDIPVIESAVKFWFNDEDFKDGHKVWRYFSM